MKYGIIDKVGRVIVPFQYSDLRFFSEGLAAACQNNKYGFIDQDGHTVIPFVYDDVVSGFFSGISFVRQNGRVGAIDRRGEWVIPCEFEAVDAFNTQHSERMIVAKKDGKWGAINRDCAVVVPFIYDSLGYDFENDTALFRRGNDVGLLTNGGKEILLNKYDEVSSFSEGRLLVSKDTLSGFVDSSGNEIVPCVYPLARDYNEGMVVVATKGKYGYLDLSGRLAIPQIYTNGWDFSEGLGRVCSKNRKWGFVDKTGATVIPFEYSSVSRFNEGVAVVERNGSYGVINQCSNVVIPFSPDYIIGYFHEGIAEIEKEDLESFKLDGPKGFMDLSGRIIVACQYEKVSGFHNGVGWIKDNGLWGCVNNAGDVVIPCRYNDFGRFGEIGLAVVGVEE